MAKPNLKTKSSIFTKATVVKTTEPPAKKDNKKEVDLGDDLNVIAAIDALTKTLAGVKSGIEVVLKEKMADEFVKDSLKSHRKPVNFRGVSSKATASCEMRKRSIKSFVDGDEVAYLKTHGLVNATETVIVKDAVPERYFFNPEAFADENLVQLISDRLDGLKTADGESLIMLQEYKPAVKQTVVTSTALDEAAAKIEDSEILREIFQILSVSALGKYNLKDTSLQSISAILNKAKIISLNNAYLTGADKVKK